MVVKDWVTVTLSVLALGVSAGTAYVNLLRQSDDIRMISGGVELVGDAIGVHAQKSRPITLTFINAGNRTGVIYRIRLAMARTKLLQRSRSCIYPRLTPSVAREFTFAPIIIKPAEITAREFLEGEDTVLTPEDRFPVREKTETPFAFASIKAGLGDPVYGCLIVSLSTPDIASYDAEIPLTGLIADGGMITVHNIEEAASLGDMVDMKFGKIQLHILLQNKNIALF